MSGNSSTPTNVGTERYVAPERLEEDLKEGDGFSIQSDIWSAGITLAELAKLEYPYSVTGFTLITTIANATMPTFVEGRYSDKIYSFLRLFFAKWPSARATPEQLLQNNFCRQ